jgi:ribose-phosphate pyrophosphokinase
MPYFSYAKGDKKDEPRVSIRARVCADALQDAGADRVVTVDLHAPQIQGFFRVPVDDLYAYPVLCDAVERLAPPNLVVVSPDAGFVKKARLYAQRLRARLVVGDKVRSDHTERAEVIEIIGDVRDKTALVVDDFTISGGTLASVATRLIEEGASRVYVAVTHAVFSEGSMERIADSPICRLFVTDTVENQPVTFCDKIEVVSVAPFLAEAIRRIHNRESISVLFPQ